MAEYIEREDVYNTLKAMYCDECTDEKCQMCEYAKIMFVLDNLPIADVQPVKRGRWIDIHEYCKMNGYIPSGVAVYYWCSECMKEQEKTSDFCPCCGADMRSPEAIKG